MGRAGAVGATRRSLASRVSAGHLLMLAAGLLGALLTLAALRRAEATVPVVVARDAIPAGTTVTAAALGVTEIRADARLVAALLRPGDVDAAVGRVARVSIARGDLVHRSALRPAAAGAAPRSMSFAIPAARAVSGDLTAGDRVDVLGTDRDGRAGYVLVDAEVLAVDGGGGAGPLRGGADDVAVTLAVDDRAALALASALESATVTLVRATGAAPLRHPPRFGEAPA